MPKKRSPSSYYFKNLYSAPFHQNVDRIGQVNLRTFDPFVPESRQTVANCKKHRSQRHNLSDKCKHVLSIVDSQEGLLAVKPMTVGEGIASQGGIQQKTEISIKFGDGIPETAKEYIKNWIEQSGMVNKPYSRQYDVHNLKDEQAHGDKPYVVMMAPFEDLSKLQEKQLPQLFASFNENPRKFSKKYKVGNVRIYSVDKISGEDDAMGFKNYLPLKIVGKEMIGKNLKKSNELIKAAGAVQQPTSGVYVDGVLETPKNKTIMSPERAAKQEHLERKVASINHHMEELKRNANIVQKLKKELSRSTDDAQKKLIEGKIHRLEEKNINSEDVIFNNKEFIRTNYDKDKVEEILRPLEERYNDLSFKIDMAERKRKTKENHTKQRKIISDLVNPNKNLAANRGKSGMDPIGRALQVVETGAKSGINIINAVKEQGILNEKKDLDALENEAKDTKRKIEQAKKQPGGTRVTTVGSSAGQNDEGEESKSGDEQIKTESPLGVEDLQEILDVVHGMTPDERKKYLDDLDPEIKTYVEANMKPTSSNLNDKPEPAPTPIAESTPVSTIIPPTGQGQLIYQGVKNKQNEPTEAQKKGKKAVEAYTNLPEKEQGTPNPMQKSKRILKKLMM